MTKKNVSGPVQCTMVYRFKTDASVKDALSMTYGLVDSRYASMNVLGKDLYSRILNGELNCVNVGVDTKSGTLVGTNGSLDAYPMFIQAENRWDDSTPKGVVLNRVEENGVAVEFSVFYPSFNRLVTIKAGDVVEEYNKYKFANAVSAGTKGGTIRAKKGSFPIREISIEKAAAKKNVLKDGIKLSLGQVLAVQKVKDSGKPMVGVYVFIRILNNAALVKIRDSFVEQANLTLSNIAKYSGDAFLKDVYKFAVFATEDGCSLVGLVNIKYVSGLLAKLGSYNLPLGKLWVDARCIDGEKEYSGTMSVIYDNNKTALSLVETSFEGDSECTHFAQKTADALISAVFKTGAKLAEAAA